MRGKRIVVISALKVTKTTVGKNRVHQVLRKRKEGYTKGT